VLDFYIKPYSHIGSYCIGLFLALLIKSVKDKTERKQYLMQKKFLIIGWTLTAITISTILFAIHPWNKGSEPHPLISMIYGSLHRTLWSLCLAFIIFVCVNGSGGLVNSILSWSPLIPLSRLTYSVYLIHPIVHWMKLATIRERIHVSHYDGVSYSLVLQLILVQFLNFSLFITFGNLKMIFLLFLNSCTHLSQLLY
jgi:peptidoglycan/LPS O-acetylase OafA/YrhL